MRNGTKIAMDKMDLKHLFYSFKKFVPMNKQRTRLLTDEFKRRNLKLPLEYKTFQEYQKSFNSVKIKERLGIC